MSRIGKLPVKIVEGVEVKIDGNKISVKGPKGELHLEVKPEIKLEIKDNNIILTRTNDLSQTRAYHGLFRSLLSGMVLGVTKGFIKELEMSGVGYKAKIQAKDSLILNIGYSSPVTYKIPEGIEVKVEEETKITISGIDKQIVGQVAATIRKLKPCEPYKGKGIKNVGEVIRRKVGKAAKAAGAS